MERFLDWFFSLFDPSYKERKAFLANPPVAESEARVAVSRRAQILAVDSANQAAADSGSWFGAVNLMAPGESWPEFEGEPLIAVCQLDLRNVDGLPECLRDVELLSLFTQADFSQNEFIEDMSNPADKGWVVRTYPHVEALVAIDPPPTKSWIKPLPANWANPFDDVPDSEDPERPSDVDIGVVRALELSEIFPSSGTKVGGWPYFLQGAPAWCYQATYWGEYARKIDCDLRFEFAVQIDSEPTANAIWLDGGVISLARSRVNPNLWAWDLQFH